MGYNSTCVSLAGIVVNLACLHTQLFSILKTFAVQTNWPAITQNAEFELPMDESIFTFIEGQELRG